MAFKFMSNFPDKSGGEGGQVKTVDSGIIGK